MRRSFLAVVVGLVAAVALIGWTRFWDERPRTSQTAVALVTVATSVPLPTLTASSTATAMRRVAAQVEGAGVVRMAIASSTPIPTATRLPATPTLPPPPTLTPSPTPPIELGLTADEIQLEVERALIASGSPLRDPTVRLLPPDRVVMNGTVPIAFFRVPVEIEARLSVDDAGAVRVKTVRLDAGGTALPGGLSEDLSRQIDDGGSRAIGAALPPNSSARRVRVLTDRVAVELNSGD